MLLWMLGSALAQNACEEPSSVQELHDYIGAMKTAYELEDQGRFGAYLERAHTTLKCLPGPVAPADAAELHFAAALYVVGEGEAEKLTRMLCAVKSINPAYAGEGWVPPGHPVLRTFASTECSDETVEQTLDNLHVDGKASGTVPGSPAVRPYIAQWQEGESWTTDLIYAGHVAPGPIPLPTEPPKPVRSGGNSTRAVGIATMTGSLLVAAAGGVIAQQTASGYTKWEPYLTESERADYNSQLKPLNTVGVALLGVGLGGTAAGAVLTFK